MRLILILGVFFCIMPFTTFSSTNDFSRTLYMGMRGEDVKELQRFLNIDSETRVAEIGAGSPGNETNYFGVGTKNALAKFQEKYRAEVLVPAGLVSGTGVFGVKTRERVNAVVRGSQRINIPLTQNTSVTPIEKGEVILMFPSQYSGKTGTAITLSGVGFTPTENTIYFGNDHAIIGASSWNGQSITIKVPDIPKGIYSVFIKNARGESNRGQWFIVTDGKTQGPEIESVAPNIVRRGDTITVKGLGFLPKGNMIQYGAGVAKDVPSKDGVSLSFTIPANIFGTTAQSPANKTFLPMWAHVINENGVSGAKSFTLGL